MFKGYCFKKVDGRHLPPLELNDAEAAWEFVIRKKDRFPELRVVDMDDNIVIHTVKGKVVFPDIKGA